MDQAASLNVGVAAHITAASATGPRYAPEVLPAERVAPENGIWLCQTCAKLIDNDDKRFTVDVLRAWKLRAENTALTRIGKPENSLPEERPARAKLRSVFCEALGSLLAGETDPFHILSTHRITHDAAVAEFRYHVSPNEVAEYDQACQRFRSVRQATQPGIIAFYEQKITGRASGSNPQEIIAAIEQLLSFALP